MANIILAMKNRTSKHQKSFKQRLGKAVVVLVVAIIFTIVITNTLVDPIIKKTGETKISESTNYAVNLAVISAMQGTVTYDDLIHIVTDASGRITMLQANSIQINSLSRDVVDNTYNYIMEKVGKSLNIPLGSFSGLPIFSGLGPSVIVPTMPYGSVKCKFLSEFVSAGINQTVHKIYIAVQTSISLVLPFNNITVDDETEVLISESLIIGEIPDTFLMAESKSDLLNMVG